jgi:hypothetical protein
VAVVSGLASGFAVTKLASDRSEGPPDWPRSGTSYGYGPRSAERAIFNIVGSTGIRVGRLRRANNFEGGNSREARPETSHVRQRALRSPLSSEG